MKIASLRLGYSAICGGLDEKSTFVGFVRGFRVGRNDVFELRRQRRRFRQWRLRGTTRECPRKLLYHLDTHRLEYERIADLSRLLSSSASRGSHLRTGRQWHR